MITIKDIAYVRYQVTDLEQMEAFLTDFGLHRADRTANTLYMRGAGPAHHVHVSHLGPDNRALGFGLRAGSSEDLERLAPHLGKQVEDNAEPGGGRCLRLVDPAGFRVDLVHGDRPVSPLPTRSPVEMNHAAARRRVGAVIRLKPQPSSVMRLGHVALMVADFPRTLSFYQDLLGFRPSDTYWAGAQENTIAAFLHCGLGEEWTDHHTIALIAAPDGRSRFDHSAFEVLDFDDLMQGNEYLKSRAYVHAWGVGRHIQGSQLFDYWRDPFGNKIEHWTDGDLVNDSSPVGRATFSPDELRQWAPPLTPAFRD